MNAQEMLAKYFLAHPVVASLVVFSLGALILLSRLLVSQWPMPPATAPRWERMLWFVVVNLPDFGRSIDGKTWLGIRFSIPFLTWTLRPAVNPVDKAREVLGEPKPAPPRSGDVGMIDIGVMLCVFVVGMVLVFVFSGCGPELAYVRALQVKGEASDALVTAHVGWSEARQLYHDNIRKNAKSLADGERMLEELKAKEAKVDSALIVGRESVRKLSESLSATGAVKRKDWTALTLQVFAAISTMVATLAEFNVTIDWLPPNTWLAPTSSRERKCYQLFANDQFLRINCNNTLQLLAGAL